MACSTCSGGCSGCSGCRGSCTGYCYGCSGSCGGQCSSDCGGGCSNCTSCTGSCQGGCSGCTGCSGCGGCGSGCKGACKGSCKTECTGCGSDCSGSCSACTGTCTGACDNGCTASGMAEFYAALGDSIGMEEIILAADMNEVVTALARELERRGKTCSVKAAEVETIAEDELRDAVRADLQSLGYDGSTNPATERMTSAEVQDYISYLQTLYGIVLTT